MTEYLVTIAASARKELKDLPSQAMGRLLPKIRELAGNPRPVGCKKLQGYIDRWRIRVGNYRVVYAIDEENEVPPLPVVATRSVPAVLPIAANVKVAPYADEEYPSGLFTTKLSLPVELVKVACCC